MSVSFFVNYRKEADYSCSNQQYHTQKTSLSVA